MIRTLQPDIVINNRADIPGDYDTPEQKVGEFNRDRPWETCITIAAQWAWKTNDRLKSFKDCIRKLNAAKGGGYIFQSDHSVPSNVSTENYDCVVRLV
jgi:alpha-L-fucosidase